MKKLTQIFAIVLTLVLALSAAACSAPSSKNVLKVGASPSPHAELLAAVKPLLAEQGIELEIVEFDDYVLPNTALENKELDANFFQHLPYLEDFNQKNGSHLVSAAAIHFEPLGIYAGKTTSLDALPDGAVIAVPNDATNEARALLLLEAQGLITLAEDAGLAATPQDIIDNPKNLKIEELEAAQVPRVLADVDLAVANGNYALSAQIVDKLLVIETNPEAANEYANILAVRAGDENREDIQKLIEALTSQTVLDCIEEKFSASVIPVFEQ